MVASTARSRSRRPPEVRRTEILDAAARAFLESGITSATMDDVARAADVAKGTVYLYFPSREALIEALRGRFVERIATRAARLLEAPPGERADHLDRYLVGVVDDALDYGELQHALFHETAGHGALDAVTNTIGAFIEGGAASGEFSVSDPMLAAAFLVEGVQGVVVNAAHEPRPGRRAVRTAVLEASRRLLVSG